MWVRGLKLDPTHTSDNTDQSHPVWVRGLKLAKEINKVTRVCVAPRVGAWIETASIIEIFGRKESHPVWVRGLKQNAK